jgi:hypothetical protein
MPGPDLREFLHILQSGDQGAKSSFQDRRAGGASPRRKVFSGG